MHFKATIAQTSLERSKEKGTLSVRLRLDLQGDKDGFLPAGVEKRQYANLWLTDRTIDRTRKTLRELGWGGKDLNDLHYDNPLENVECSVTGDFETGMDGRDRFRVNWVNPKSREIKDLGDTGDFKAFNRHFADGKSGESIAQTYEKPNAGGNDEQLPF
jgi:hypothetical protein